MHSLTLLRPMVVFTAVIDHGSFKKAAADIGLSAPLVSQMVTELEEQLNTQLLYRSTRKLTLTQAGQQLYTSLKEALNDIEEGLAIVQPNMTNRQGRLRITAPTIMANRSFVNFLREFRKHHPKINLILDMSDERLNTIDSGIDLAIRIGSPEDSRKVARKLFEAKRILCASPKIFTPLESPADLAKLHWVCSPRVAGPIHLTHVKNQRTQTIQIESMTIINNGTLVREMVEQGEGFALFPEFAIGDLLKSGTLMNLLPQWQPKSLDVFAIYTARRSSLSIARGFVDALALHFKNN